MFVFAQSKVCGHHTRIGATDGPKCVTLGNYDFDIVASVHGVLNALATRSALWSQESKVCTTNSIATLGG